MVSNFFSEGHINITQKCVGRTAYVLGLLRDMSHSTKSKSFSSINFSFVTKVFAGRISPADRSMEALLQKRLKWVTMTIIFLWGWELVIVTCNVWNKMPESILQITRGRWCTFVKPGSLLLLFMGKIQGKGKTSPHCSYSCRYSMAQNAMANLCEMGPIAKLKCAPFLIICVSHYM